MKKAQRSNSQVRLGEALLNDNDDDDDPQDDNGKDDWRAFRAKLVGQSTYDAGSLIETGSLVLSKVEDTLGCHDLRQPYLHKAVILLLDHDPTDFTQGIVLNRPTDLVLNDDDILYDGQSVVVDNTTTTTTTRESKKKAVEKVVNSWPMNFGGDLAGLFDDERQAMIVCLYRRQCSDAVGDVVLDDLCVTSHAGACDLIRRNEYTVDDFVCFYGFCGWEPGQLQKEIARGSWTMVSTTPDTIWKQLQLQEHRDNNLQHDSKDPRAAGLSMWEYWVARLGQNPDQDRNAFSDLMLKAWATEYLCLARQNEDDYFVQDDKLQKALEALSSQGGSILVEPGMVFRTCVGTPFLLNDQYLHKAIVMVLHESDQASIGLVLNLPSTDTFTLETPQGKQVDFCIRFGGASGKDNDEDPLLWLHCSRSLRKLSVGTCLQEELNGRIHLCTADQVSEAIDLGLALPREFLLIQGFTVWEKEENGEAGGLAGQVLNGNLEKVPTDQIENVWSLLQSQELLTEHTLDWNVQNTLSAWTIAGLATGNERNGTEKMRTESVIFESDVSLTELADVALKVWMTIFLLGDAKYAPLN